MGRIKKPLKDRKLRGLRYPNLIKAAQAARRLKARTARDYYEKCKQDPLLPSDPENYYGRDAWKKFGGWPAYLIKRTYAKPYRTIEQAMASIQKLEIKTWRQYCVRRVEDPRLPANPKYQYSEDWEKIGRWNGYLGNPIHYATYEEASQAAQKLRMRTRGEYRRRRFMNLRLPSNPNRSYQAVWKARGGWPGFLGQI